MKTYRWRTIVDDKTCLECRMMDGAHVSEDEIKRGLCPPLHKEPTGCRCTLELITEKKFEIT